MNQALREQSAQTNLLFTSTPKIVVVGDIESVPLWLTTAFEGHAHVLRLVGVPGALNVQDAMGGVHPLDHPLTALTLLLELDDPSETALRDAAQTLWTDAGLTAPEMLSASLDASDLPKITQAVLSLQSAFVQAAARRNVDLLQQVAVLRQITEDQSASFDQAMAFFVSNEDTAKMVYQSTPYGPGITLAPDTRVTQRLPLSVHPRLIGGVSVYVDAPAETVLALAIWSEELQVVLSEEMLTVPAGASVLFLPFALERGLTPKLLDLMIDNRGFDPIQLQSALCESPEERARGGQLEDFSLRVDLSGPTVAVAQAYPLEARLLRVPNSAVILEKHMPKTPGFEERKWLSLARKTNLLVHPLPKTTAIASLDSVPRLEAFGGVTSTVHLRDNSASIVYACLSVTRAPVSFPDHAAVERYASGESADAFDEVARSEWVAILPGTEQPLRLELPDPWHAEDKIHVNFLTTTRGQSTAYANLTFRNVALLEVG